MKFEKIIGKVDKNLVARCEAKMSDMFLLLAAKYDLDTAPEKLGGDPLIAYLLIPYQHYLTYAIPTAATDGKRYYWNPDFIDKLSIIGLRFVAMHETLHATFMHPSRCMGRNPKIWNIAVDFIVNGFIMDDLKKRGKNPRQDFNKHLGNFITLSQYASLIKDPFNIPEDLKKLVYTKDRQLASEVELPGPEFEGELTDEQKKEVQRRQAFGGFFFADPDLEESMKDPEKIYSYLYQQFPKCPECGKLGVYTKPSPSGGKKQKGQNQGNQPGQQGQGNQPGQGQGKGNKQGQGNQPGGNQPGGNQPGNQPGQGQGNQPGQGCGHGCGTCGGADSVDIFGLGGTLDEHMSSNEDKDELTKRLAEAIEHAKREIKSKGIGSIPGGLEDEIGELSKPQIKWQDSIKSKITRIKQEGSRNDYTRFKTRPLFYNMLIPKKKDYYTKFVCLLDCSGSMSDEDISYGVSQLQALDRNSEGWIVPADATIYYDKAVEVKACSAESLKKTKVVGRGGTCFMDFTKEYKSHFGDPDFLIIITDGFISDQEMNSFDDPTVPLYWILTSQHASFSPKYGKVFHLRNGDVTAK